MTLCSPGKSSADGRRLAVFFAALLSGCVTTYQPLVGLQRPVVLDPQTPNFEGMRMMIRCVPTETEPADEARQLCRRVRNLFANQGAEVDTEVPIEGRGTSREEGKEPDLVVEIKSRIVHEDDSTLLWIASWMTFTLVPAVTEATFALEVSVRDSQGALLASDDLQARFIRYFGFGVWSVNGALNWIVRSDEEEISTDDAQRDFSRDLYGQLSQLAFHAKMRAVVLRGFEPQVQPSPPKPGEEPAPPVSDAGKR